MEKKETIETKASIIRFVHVCQIPAEDLRLIFVIWISREGLKWLENFGV